MVAIVAMVVEILSSRDRELEAPAHEYQHRETDVITEKR